MWRHIKPSAKDRTLDLQLLPPQCQHNFDECQIQRTGSIIDGEGYHPGDKKTL